MTLIDVSTSVDVQLPWKSVVNNATECVSGDGPAIKCKNGKHLSVKGTSLHRNINILQVLQKSTVASDLLKSLASENVLSSSSSSSRRRGTPETDNFDDVLSMVDAAQSSVRQSVEDFKTFPEIYSYGNASAQKSLRVESDRISSCTCAAQSDDLKRSLRGWRMEAGDVTRERVKHSKKSKSYSNVFQRLVAERRLKDSTFEHHAESSKYIDEYRRRCTVGNVCNYDVLDRPILGVDFIDPYAVRIKNICSVANTCDLTALAPKSKDKSCLDLKEIAPHSAKSSSSGKKNKIPEAEDRRYDRGAADMTSSRSLPKLAPVRKSKSPKEKTSPDAKEPHPPKDRHLDVQLSRSKSLPKIKCKMTVVSPDPVSESKLASGSTREQASSKWTAKHLVERPSRISDRDDVVPTDNKISVRASRSKAMNRENSSAFKMVDLVTNPFVLENGVHELTGSDRKVTEAQTGNVIKAKCSRQKYSRKTTDPAHRPCVKLISLTLGDIGGSSESDAESLNRETSTFNKLNKQSKRRVDLLTPVAR
ncbi:uncharacterized protein LOC121368369 [Gigantopelta aegis]|uniref:uncharacterized protein LOC121368369 n=1 Tax=Gigantopelta aegis TaxID=1735272 RepID=UPI001B88E144|nr:uncharacterized protein LOC121368369 [Gigantopelta aegis]XP_041349000.1 uncharacterized protein LOC121368369 [Gigantopelta aegis]